MFIHVDEGNDLDSLSADGIFGLGLIMDYNKTIYDSFVTVLYKKKIIEKQIFSFFLSN